MNGIQSDIDNGVFNPVTEVRDPENPEMVVAERPHASVLVMEELQNGIATLQEHMRMTEQHPSFNTPVMRKYNSVREFHFTNDMYLGEKACIRDNLKFPFAIYSVFPEPGSVRGRGVIFKILMQQNMLDQCVAMLMSAFAKRTHNAIVGPKGTKFDDEKRPGSLFQKIYVNDPKHASSVYYLTHNDNLGELWAMKQYLIQSIEAQTGFTAAVQGASQANVRGATHASILGARASKRFTTLIQGYQTFLEEIAWMLYEGHCKFDNDQENYFLQSNGAVRPFVVNEKRFQDGGELVVQNRMVDYKMRLNVSVSPKENVTPEGKMDSIFQLMQSGVFNNMPVLEALLPELETVIPGFVKKFKSLRNNFGLQAQLGQAQQQMKGMEDVIQYLDSELQKMGGQSEKDRGRINELRKVLRELGWPKIEDVMQEEDDDDEPEDGAGTENQQ